MKLDALNKLLDEVNAICSEVEAETKDIKAKHEADVEALYQIFLNDMKELWQTMKKAWMREFAYPTNFNGHTYGHSCWLVLACRDPRFCESGLCQRWAYSECVTREQIVNWYFEELNHDEFELAFKEAVTKAATKKVEDTMKRNKEAKEL